MTSLAIAAAMVAVASFTATACMPEKKDKSAGPGGAPAEAAGAVAGAAPTAAEQQEAEQIFSQRCLPCHGPLGRGDGPASATLDPKPRNFTDASWQKSVTDDHIEKIIVYGGTAVAKSPAMPPNPDLDAKRGVVRGLRIHVRGLSGK